MSSYFNKISSVVSSAASSAAKQSASILSSISTVAANTSTSSSTHGSASVAIPPKTELINLFTEFCNIVDQLASLPNAESIDADIKLNQSSARPILKRMIYLLQQESDYWIDHQKFHVQQVQSSKKHIEEIEIPCLEHLLQANIIQGIVNRALTDTPRGLMPLALTAISHLLRTIEYPLLPHQSVYKSVAKLISFASRYELIISEIVSKEDERYVSYRRRIEIGLTSLLRTIWRKIVENPPVLEFFILTDKRKSITSSTATSTTVRTQIDILSGLFPMILEPKVSYFVQETLLTAINVGDVRIISYLADNTNFPEMMVKLICDHFRESVTLIQSSLQQDPIQQHGNKTPGPGSTTASSQQKLLNLFFGSDKSHLSVFLASAASANNPFGSAGPGSNFPVATPNGKKLPPNSFQSPRPTPLGVASQTVPNTIAALGPGEMNSLEKFIKSILFMKAIYSNLRQQHLAMENHIISLSKIISASTPAVTEESGNPEVERETTSVTKKIDANEEELHEKRFFLQKLESLCNKIAFFYYYEFLSDILLPSLESTTNELLTIIHYYLLRILLLSLHDQDHGSRGASSDVYDNSFAILGNPQKIKKNKRRKSSLIFKKENQQQIGEIGGVAAVNKLVAEEEKINPRRDRSQSEGTSSYDLLQELFPNEALLSLTLKSLFITHHHNHDKSKGWEASLGKKADYQFHSNWFLLLDRSTSLSKVLSLLSIQCVQTIFEVAPPIFLMELQSIQPIRMNQTEYQQLVLFMKQQQASGTTETSKDAVNKKSTSNNLWNLRMLEDYQISFQVELKKILESFPVKEEGSDDGFVSGGLSSKLIEHSIQQILARLYHHGDATYFAQYSQGHLTSATTSSFAHWWETLLHHTVAASAATPITPSSSEVYYYAYNDYIIDRFLRRLQSYFTMTIDEQILFSQVLYDQYLPIALLIVIQSNDLLCKQQIALLAQFSKKMQYLLDEMEKKYLKQINDVDKKLVYFRQYLFEEAKDFIPNNSNDNITTNHDVKQTTTSNSQSIPPSTPSKTNSNANNFTTPQKNNNNIKPSNQTSVFNTPLKSPASAPITPSNTSTAPSSLFKKSFSFLGAATSNNHSNPSSSHGNGSREGSVHAGSTVTTTDTTSPSNATISTSEEDDKVNPVKPTTSSYNRVVVRKMIEKESNQHQSILTGYIILQEMFYELQSIFYAVDYLKALYTSDLLPHTLLTTSQPSLTQSDNQVEEEEPVLTYDEYIANLKSEHDIQMAMVGSVGEQSQQWVELAVNEYEEDEADLMELTKFAQTVTSSMNRNDVMKLEVELEDLYQVFASIEQMISA